MWGGRALRRERTALPWKVIRSGWPEGPQASLTKAVAGRAPLSPAWDEWCLHHDVKNVDVFRILPTVYERLSREGVRTSEHVKGVARHCYAAGTARIMMAKGVAKSMEKEGIPCMALKGVALTCMEGRPVRHMDDVDVLVPFSEARQALEIAIKEGWRPGDGEVEGGRIDPSTSHAIGMRRGAERFDLHWRSVHQDQSDSFDQPVWRRAERSDGMLVPSRTDFALQAVMHGTRTDGRHKAWPLDLMWASAQGLDWDVLLGTAVRRRLVVPLRAMAEAMQEFMPHLMPEEALKAVRSLESTVAEAVEHWAASSHHFMHTLEETATMFKAWDTRRAREGDLDPIV